MRWRQLAGWRAAQLGRWLEGSCAGGPRQTGWRCPCCIVGTCVSGTAVRDRRFLRVGSLVVMCGIAGCYESSQGCWMLRPSPRRTRSRRRRRRHASDALFSGIATGVYHPGAAAKGCVGRPSHNASEAYLPMHPLARVPVVRGRHRPRTLDTTGSLKEEPDNERRSFGVHDFAQ